LLDYEQDTPTLDNGGRILDAVIRPYPAKTAGIPLKFDYEMTTGKFVFDWAIPEESKETSRTPLRCRETEIFLPSHLIRGRKVIVSGLSDEDRWSYDQSRQTMFVVVKDIQPGRRYRIEVAVHPPHRPQFDVNDLWMDFGGQLFAVGVLVVSVVIFLVSGATIKMD
jgi:hypothetical protein